jgi:DNA-directed RNA polymerase specialized sigma24 family protein
MAPVALLTEDFIQSALQKAMSGERGYDPTKTLFNNLCQIISSEISNAVNSYEYRNAHNPDDDKIINIQDFRPSPEDSAIYDQTLADFLSYLESRDPLAKMAAEQILLYGITKSIELSVEMKLPVSDIENIKKRLRRLAAKYVEERGARREEGISWRSSR